MKLSKLQLISFRNYDKFELEFDNEKPVTLITGENGKGKTNILEAIYLLSIGKTFRGAHQEDLIKWGMDYFTVKGELRLDNETDETTNLDVSFSTYPRKMKSFRINEVKTPHTDYLGTFITVLFHPKDLNMLYLEPSLRRKYLNLILSQTDKYYLEALTNYTKILKQRNALLEEIGNGSHSQAELDVWDERLVGEGQILIEKRQELIIFFNSHIQALYRKISGGKESLTIEYNSSAGPAMAEPPAVPGDYLKRLRLKRDKDIRYGTTTIGPHRDDIKFLLNGRSIEEFASRGEFRTILIALKITEIAYIKKVKKHYPVLLLDDVFSELDEGRQEHLFKAIEGCQAIITTTELPDKTIDKKFNYRLDL